MATDNRYVNGAAKLSQRINTIRNKLAVPALTNEIGALLLRRNLDRFDREVDPDGRPWTELAPSTIAARRREGYGNKGKLRRTDSLRNAIQAIRGRADGGVYINTGAGIRLGVVDPEQAEKARYLHYGTRHIPVRRIIGISALDVKAVDSFLRRVARKLENSL